MNECMTHDLVLPFLVLAYSGQIPVDKEIGGLEKVALLRNLLDWVSSIAKDALLAVDVGDPRAHDSRVLEARIIDAKTILGPVDRDIGV